MRLHKLAVKGFRKLKHEEINFGEATFLIGPNNAGKSSVLRAVEHLLSGNKRIPENEWFSELDEETGEQKPAVSEIVLEAEFRDVPASADTWRGFRGRVFSYGAETEYDTGRCIFYRKTYRAKEDVLIEMKSLSRTLKPQFSSCKTAYELVDAGADTAEVEEVFGGAECKAQRKRSG